MSLQATILEDLKAAMKARDDVAKRTLRMIKAELSKQALDLGRDLTEKEELAVLMSAAKTRKESIAQYEEAGREDLASAEREELEVVEGYLPKQMSEDEAEAAIQALATEGGFTEKKQMGQLMKAVMAQYRGQIDGKLASKIAGKLLS